MEQFEGTGGESDVVSFICALESFLSDRCLKSGFQLSICTLLAKKASRHSFYPIRSETKTNRDSLVHVFPRFASATCNYLSFDWFTGLSVSLVIKAISSILV